MPHGCPVNSYESAAGLSAYFRPEIEKNGKIG